MLSMINDQFELRWFTRLRHYGQPRTHIMVTLPRGWPAVAPLRRTLH